MNRYGRILFFAAFVAVVGGAAWTGYVVQRSRTDETSAAVSAAAGLLDAVVQTENAARDYTVVRDPALLDAYTSQRARLNGAIGAAQDAVGDDPELRSLLRDEVMLVDRWATVTAGDVATPGSGTSSTRAAARDPMLAEIRTADDVLLRAIDRHHRDQRDDAGTRGIATIVGLCVAFAALNWALFVRTERRETRARDRQLAFAEQLQGARSEDEARGMLARHLETLAPGMMVVVSDGTDRSEAGQAITANGERIGTVIVRSKHDLRAATERWVHDSILRAAPVLGTLRTLAVAQAHAATDPLTGLGNRRLVEDALARLAAQSRRSGEGFAVAMIDVDRFKTVNDTYGHDAGDAVLVAIGGVLNAETREYDIVGRRGGDEFVMLLAGLGSTEAVNVMERCRAAIGALRLGSPAITTTASFGVAAVEEGSEPGDPGALVRAADNAVYEAKARGGDCVVGVTLATR
jgi:diguanylate cyclase (GGDEF)-like protein